MKLIIPLPEAGFDEGNFYAHAGLGERHSVHRSPNRRGEAGRLPLRLRASHATSQEHHSDQTAAPAKLQAATDAPPQTRCQATIPQNANAETLPQDRTLTSSHRKARPKPDPPARSTRYSQPRNRSSRP